jgi:catechol 2,3-dioxygenase-like lactoylglutathione lyase family enzyme
MNLAVEHIGLAARDTAALKDWYVRVLGARAVFNDGKSPPAFLLEVPGGLKIEIYPADTSLDTTGNNKLAGWRHLAVRVDSIETARDELARHGAIFGEPIKPAAGGGRVLFFKDGEGNLLHLVERAEGSILNRPGQNSAVRSPPP